ncbi:MAG: toprim domain-containing protein, partial [Spirochaetaceae bacterium]|nr:toprim domain-containing protein [Spirochaetaceae bacterium]
TNVVAPLGTALTDEQARLLRRWAERAYLVFDADRAGRDAAVRGILTCRRNGLSCAVVVPGKDTEAFKDPADILKELGAEVLQGYVKCFMLDCEYLMFHSKSLFDLSNAEGKTKAVTYLFPYLETLDSDVSRETAIEQIADAFGVDRTAIRNDFTRNSRTYSGGKGEREALKSPKTARINDELYMLIAVSLNQRLYPGLRTKLLIKDVEDPRAKELFEALEACYINDESGIDALLARIRSEEVRNFVVETGRSKYFLANPEKLLWDGIQKCTRRRLEKRRIELITAINAAKKNASETRNDFHEETRLEELLAEKMHIDAELHQGKEDNV